MGHTLPAHALASLGVMEIVQDESPVKDLKRNEGGDKASSYYYTFFIHTLPYCKASGGTLLSWLTSSVTYFQLTSLNR